MRRLLRSTRVRAALVAAGILGVALVAASAVIVLSWPAINGRESDSALVEQSQRIKSDFFDHDHNLASDDLPLESANGTPVDAAIVDAAGTVLAQTPRQPIRGRQLLSLAATARARGNRSADVTDGKGIDRSVYATRLDTEGDVLVVSRSLTEDHDDLQTTIPILAGLLILTVATAGVLSYRLAGSVLQPVQQIAGLARRISERDLHQRVDVPTSDGELGELATTFNAMLGRLEMAFGAQRTFTADASHELRAPITVMRLELERGLSRARSAQEYREVLEWVQADVDHLARITDQLLFLSRADAGLLRAALRPVDVTDLLSEAAARWQRTADAKGVSIELDLRAPGSVTADAELLRRLVDDLLDNAVRHAPPGSAVRVQAGRSRTGLDIEVVDQGPGVALELRPRLFSRFGRAAGARTGAGTGVGLGLALSATIARAHGGWLELVDRDSPGAAFRLHLPGAAAG